MAVRLAILCCPLGIMLINVVEQSLRMSIQEIKEEFRQQRATEQRGHIRERQRPARARMMHRAAADVVITNPTHMVAPYDAATMAAPRVEKRSRSLQTESRTWPESMPS